MRSTGTEPVFFDAGIFIGSLLRGDGRHAEARPIVEAARRGEMAVCTTAGILSEVYAALTWAQAQPPHGAGEAAAAVRLLVAPPSQIQVLPEGPEVALRTLDLAAEHGLAARRVHDARHAAAALVAGVVRVYTYDIADWRVFAANGIRIVGPPSVAARLP